MAQPRLCLALDGSTNPNHCPNLAWDFTQTSPGRLYPNFARQSLPKLARQSLPKLARQSLPKLARQPLPKLARQPLPKLAPDLYPNFEHFSSFDKGSTFL